MKFFKDLLTGEKLPTNAKFQHNISKITPALKAFPQKHREMGCESHYSIGLLKNILRIARNFVTGTVYIDDKAGPILEHFSDCVILL